MTVIDIINNLDEKTKIEFLNERSKKSLIYTLNEHGVSFKGWIMHDNTILVFNINNNLVEEFEQTFLKNELLQFNYLEELSYLEKLTLEKINNILS